MPADVFPTLRIQRDGLEARGVFAEAQAAFLRPDASAVSRLDGLLQEHAIGVVAHFYMDPELQGVLSACTHRMIHVSDSLVMADRAVQMVDEGAKRIVVLGVDFMSENVRAMLDAAGHTEVPVYRVAVDPIGCSLAESAEASAYGAYLSAAAERPSPLHVVYINTSLRTKAKAHARIPTITCTSGNVVATVLQAASEVPDLHVAFGPDTYMGENLKELFASLAQLDDDAVKALHPAHDTASIASLLERFDYFREGNCVVHDMFGQEVVDAVRTHYPDVFVTAHLEVPGEMFELGLEAQRAGRGRVGSTADLLRFILAKLDEAIEAGSDAVLPFILGTEAGMITPIVRQVEAKLAALPEGAPAPKVDIVFPVAAEAVAQTGDATLPLVPGVAAGEGCSTAGGCATCPYMKMNSLDALLGVAERVAAGDDAALAGFAPEAYAEIIDGKTVAQLGGQPILHMRHFQQNGVMPPALLAHIAGG